MNAVYISSFADDTRVLTAITSEEDTRTLQSNLQTIYNWQKTKNMQFNEKKFELIRYGSNQHIKDTTSYVGPNKTKIEEKLCVKDLGVKMSNNLKFSDHIESICSKVRQKCGWIMRTLHSQDIHIMKTLWNSMMQQLTTAHNSGHHINLETNTR